MTKLKRLRLAAGLTQRQVASRLGCTHVTICLWERGENMPRPKHVPPLARMLGTTPAVLLEALAPSTSH